MAVSQCPVLIVWAGCRPWIVKAFGVTLPKIASELGVPRLAL